MKDNRPISAMQNIVNRRLDAYSYGFRRSHFMQHNDFLLVASNGQRFKMARIVAYIPCYLRDYVTAVKHVLVSLFYAEEDSFLHEHTFL